MDSATFARSINAYSDPHSDNVRGRERDALLLSAAAEWLIDAEIARRIGPFTTRKEASSRLKILGDRRKLRHVYYPRTAVPGHPPKLYTNYPSVGNKLEHDYNLSHWRFAYWPMRIVRDESELRSDAVLASGSFVARLEMDQDTEGESFLRRRLEVLRDGPVVLFATTSVRRSLTLLEVFRGWPSVFVAPLEAILADPYGLVYVNGEGQAARVPTPV